MPLMHKLSRMASSTNQLAEIARILLSELQAVTKNLNRLKEANSANSILEDWHEDMLHHFVGEVGLNIHRMELLRKHREHNSPTLAYVVRNLLELHVWIDYCCKSKMNARQFYEDRWKDGLGLKQAIQNLVNVFPAVPNVSDIEMKLASFENTLQQTALTAGMPSLSHDYKRVNEAADEIGFKKAFVSLNTLLSKYAHPTSMTVLTFIHGEANNRIFSSFFVIGVGLAAAGYRTINEYIMGLGIGV